MTRIALVAATVLFVGACGGDAAGSEAFCDATRAAVELGNLEEFPEELNTMVDEAPEEIADAATTVRDGFKDAIENNDPAAIQADEFTEAAEELGKYADENCENLDPE